MYSRLSCIVLILTIIDWPQGADAVKLVPGIVGVNSAKDNITLFSITLDGQVKAIYKFAPVVSFHYEHSTIDQVRRVFYTTMTTFDHLRFSKTLYQTGRDLSSRDFIGYHIRVPASVVTHYEYHPLYDSSTDSLRLLTTDRYNSSLGGLVLVDKLYYDYTIDHVLVGLPGNEDHIKTLDLNVKAGKIYMWAADAPYSKIDYFATIDVNTGKVTKFPKPAGTLKRLQPCGFDPTKNLYYYGKRNQVAADGRSWVIKELDPTLQNPWGQAIKYTTANNSPWISTTLSNYARFNVESESGYMMISNMNLMQNTKISMAAGLKIGVSASVVPINVPKGISFDIPQACQILYNDD